MHKIALTDLQQQFPADFYQGLSMFGALSADCLKFLLEQGTAWYADSDEGDNSDKFYVVLSGSISFFQAKESGSDKVFIRRYQAGEQVGFVGMIGLHQRRGDAVMADSGYLLEVSSDLFHQLCDKFPQMFQIFLINIAREMSREISHLDQMHAEKS